MRLVSAALTVALVGSAHADTYRAPDDFGIACLELATGKELWRTPGKLRAPVLRVNAGVVVASEDPAFAAPGPPAALVVDAATGRVVTRTVAPGGVGELKPLPRHLAHAGHTVAYGSGGTSGLFYEDYSTEFVWFDWDASDVHVVGNLAVLAFDFESGGEVFAYDLVGKKLAWDFRAYDHVAMPEHAHTDIAVDGDRVLVSTDEHVFAVEAATGKVVWRTDLPRQPIRRYDAAWTAFSRAGELYILRVYEDLFALSVRDGTVAWRFEAGKLAHPSPVVVGDKLYVAWRAGAIHAQSASFGGKSGARPSAIAVHKDAAGWRLTAESTRSAPHGTTRWSTLRPPPRSAKPPKIVLHLEGGRGPSYDLSAVAGGDVWVEFKGIFQRATLTIDGREVAALDIPRTL